MAATLDDIMVKLQELKDDIDEAFKGQVLSAQQTRLINGLSDLDTRLGLVQAGELRSGNGVDPGKGFSGVRVAFPPMLYAGSEWNLVGVNNDELQVGIRAADGKLLAGGGQVRLDSDGIVIWNSGTNDPFIVFRESEGGLAVGQIFTNSSNNLEMDAYAYDSGQAKLVLRSQSDSGISTIEIISKLTAGGKDWITLNTDVLYLNASDAITLEAPTALNSDYFRIVTAKTPASAADTGDAGQIAWDTNYLYVCTATNTWKRVAIATW